MNNFFKYVSRRTSNIENQDFQKFLKYLHLGHIAKSLADRQPSASLGVIFFHKVGFNGFSAVVLGPLPGQLASVLVNIRNL